MPRLGPPVVSSSPSSTNAVVLPWPDFSPIRVDVSDNIDEENVSDTELATISMRSDIGVSPSSTATPAPQAAATAKHSDQETRPVIPCPAMPHYDVAALLQQSWRKAIRVLRANPQLMTRSILCIALRQRPPAYVVQWMLRLNPNAAAVPNQGPTPLFVAVKEECSTAVVETILQAAPLALVARAAGSPYDPLAHAERERSQETDLLALLRRPVSFWFPHDRSPPSVREDDEFKHESTLGIRKRRPSSKNGTTSSSTATVDTGTTIATTDIDQDSSIPGCNRKGKSVNTGESFSSKLEIDGMPQAITPEPPARGPRHHIPSLLHRTRPLGTTPERTRPQQTPSSRSPSTWTSAERQELDNVKFLCLTLLKAHRRMLDTQHEAVNEVPHSLTESERQEFLREIEERQEEQARVCLIALDMKERAITALARRLEDRLTSTESQVSDRNLRSSYAHLYRRLMGLEEEFQTLRRATLSVAYSSSLSADSSQAVFDPDPEHRPPEVSVDSGLGKQDTDEVRSRLSDEEIRGEGSRSCLRPPWAYFRSRTTS